jgi:hypothetical protein
MSIHLALSTATLEEQHSDDLWVAALKTLSDMDRQNFNFNSPDKLKVLSDLWTLTEQAREECIGKR